jgi:polyphosphate kinase
VWKVNNLIDRKVIDALYSASQSGVQIDLIVRAMCSLRPGVPGMSDNIRVRSLIGRYLEHSRIFYFGAGTNPRPGEGNGRRGAPARQPLTAGGDAVATVNGPPVWPGLPEGGCYLMGSADMMERNLDRRVEALVDVRSPEIQSRLREILEVVLADDELAWELSADATWHKVPITKHFNAQHHFQELALSRARRRGPSESLV